jgi:CHAT domain-containing protein
VLAERQGIAYSRPLSHALDLLVTVAVHSGEKGQIRQAFDALVRSRGLVLELMLTRLALRERASEHPEIQQAFEALESARSHLARLVLRGASESASAEHRRKLETVRLRKEHHERELAALLPRSEGVGAGLDTILSRMSEGATLLSYLRYRQYEPDLDIADGLATEAAPEHYAAFVVRHGEAPLSLIPLGPAEPMDLLIREWRENLSRGSNSRGVEALSEEDLTDQPAAGENLRRRLWDPLQDLLASQGEVLVVADGPLHSLAFAALPSPRQGYLLEDGYRWRYLSAERDLAAGCAEDVGEGLLLMGGVDFDAAFSTDPQAERSIPVLQRRLSSLPASGKEVELVSGLLADGARTQKLLGEAASEAAFKELAPGQRWIHVATHGFFLGHRFAELPSLATPLALSGLALAGANRGQSGPGEDGILTAEEIAGLDLRGVEWVVLSACDTAQGVLEGKEGVLGLERAFRLAGARRTVMSQWAVEDEVALQWTRALYESCWRQGRSLLHAVHDASLQMLQNRRNRSQSDHPWYWGGWKLQGQ